MALHLNAEQKNLRRLWSEYDSFVIPPYQRPYSWSASECKQLYDDLIDAFNRPNDNDYFVGTIILAVADDQRDEYPCVVDGQQRLTTFWLMFKALSVLLPEIPSIIDMLYAHEWDGKGGRLRINSLVNDANDMEMMKKIYGWGAEDYESMYVELMDNFKAYSRMDIGDFLNATGSTMEAATLYFYYRLREFKQEDGMHLALFAKYLMTSVLIIPIEMHAPGIRDAENKALVIFETINNRGMALSDSDILKARLYSKAVTTTDKDTFVKQWDTVGDNCKFLGIEIDTLFTIYMFIEKARRGDLHYTTDIREFFDGRNGEISHYTYDKIMNSLLEIADILHRYKEMEYGTSRVAGWMQVIDLCDTGINTHGSILVAWAMKNGFDLNTLEPFLSSIVRDMFVTGQMFYEFNVLHIIAEILSTGDSRELHVTGSPSPYMMFAQVETKLAHLARVLEMGGGLLHYKLMNIVKRKRTSYIETDGGLQGVRKSYFDESIGNVAFVPTKQARQDIGFDDYMRKMEEADPECATLANNIDTTYRMVDVRRRAERKRKILEDFLGAETV